MFKTDGTDRDARDHFLSFQEREIQSMEEGGLILDATVRLESVMAHFPEPALWEHYEEIKEDKLYKKQARQRERVAKQAIHLQNSYLDALTEYVYGNPAKRWQYCLVDSKPLLRPLIP